jgi:hypothetical protein
VALALALRQVVEGVSRDFLEGLIVEVTGELSVGVAQEVVSEARLSATLLLKLCAAEVGMMVQRVVGESVKELCR